MNWPPSKAWTSKIPINGLNHFIAINYGGEGKTRWINLISVLDGNVRIRVPWNEIIDSSTWLNGWSEILDKNCIQSENKKKVNLEISGQEGYPCLHASLDSGLNIPTKTKLIRTWTDSSEEFV